MILLNEGQIFQFKIYLYCKEIRNMWLVDSKVKVENLYRSIKPSRENIRLFEKLEDVTLDKVESYRNLSSLIKADYAVPSYKEIFEELGWEVYIKKPIHSFDPGNKDIDIYVTFKKTGKNCYEKVSDNVNDEMISPSIPFILASEITDNGIKFEGYYWIKDRWMKKDEAVSYLKNLFNLNDFSRNAMSFAWYFWMTREKEYLECLKKSVFNKNRTLLKIINGKLLFDFGDGDTVEIERCNNGNLISILF